VGVSGFCDPLRGAFGDDASAAGASFRAEVDDPVGIGDEVEVMFDDHHGMAGVDQAVQDGDEEADVGHVESDGGFFEEEEVAFGVWLGGGGVVGEAGEEVGDEFDALRFAAAERRAGLAELEVTEAGIAQDLEWASDAGEGGEEGEGFFHAEVEHLSDVATGELDIERFGFEAEALAGFAPGEGGREEVHLQLDGAGALAFRASALGAIEGEPAGGVAAEARFGDLGEQASDIVEEADVGCGYGARGAADGGLIDLEDGADLLGAFGDLADFGGEGGGWAFAVFEGGVEGWQQAFAEQGTFTGTAHAGEGGEPCQGDAQGDLAEIVEGGVLEGEAGVLVGDGASAAAGGEACLFAEALAGDGGGVVAEFVEGAGGHDGTAVGSGAGSEIDDVVGAAHGGFVVFDHQEGVAATLELSKGVEQLFVIAGVQADGGFVEDIEDAAEVGAELGGEADALGFASGERRDAASEVEVTEADVDEEAEAFANFGEDVLGDGGGGSGESDCAEEVEGLCDRGPGEVVECRGIFGEGGEGSFGGVGGSGDGGVETHGAGDGVEAHAAALRTSLAVAFLPAEPGFLDGIGPGAPVDVGQVEQFSEAATLGAPSDRGVIAEVFGVEGFERSAAAGAGAFGGVDGEFALLVEGQEGSFADLECFIDLAVGGVGGPGGGGGL